MFLGAMTASAPAQAERVRAGDRAKVLRKRPVGSRRNRKEKPRGEKGQGAAPATGGSLIPIALGAAFLLLS